MTIVSKNSSDTEFCPRPVISSSLWTICAVTSNICFYVRPSWFLTTLFMHGWNFFHKCRCIQCCTRKHFKLLNVRYNPLHCLTFFSVEFALGLWLCPQILFSLPIMKFSTSAFPWRFSETGCPVPSVNSLFVPCRMRSPAEKIFFTVKVNFMQWIPRIFLRFPWSCSPSPLFLSWEDKDRP